MSPTLSGALSSDLSTLVVDVAESVTFSIAVTDSAAATTVELDQVDAGGTFISKVADLQDDGDTTVDGDATAGDGVYSAEVPLSFSGAGDEYFAATLGTSSTAPLDITGVNPLTTAQMTADMDDGVRIGDAGQTAFDTGGAAPQIIAAVQAALVGDSNVVASSVETNNTDTIEWETTDGILQGIQTDTYFGYRGASEDPAPTPIAAPAAQVAPADTLRPSDATSAGDGRNAIVLDPYNFDFAGNGGDEAPDIAGMLMQAGYSTPLQTNSAVSIGSFQDLGSNAAVVIVTHGTAGYMAQYPQSLATGVPVDFTLNDVYQTELLNHRLSMFRAPIYSPAGSSTSGLVYAVTPSFFAAYDGSMDGSIVYLGACHSGDSAGLSDAFLNDGAGAVLCFKRALPTDFGQVEGDKSFKTLLQPTQNTIGDIPGVNVDTAPISNYNLKNICSFISFGDPKATIPGYPLLADVNLVVTYVWPSTQRDLDTLTLFDGQSAGAKLSGGIYENFLGDDQDYGGSETTVIDLYDAWAAGVFTTTASVGLGTDWYMPDHGSGPAKVYIALENIHTEKQYEVQSAVVSPGQATDGADDVLTQAVVTLTGNPTNPTVMAVLQKPGASGRSG